MGPPAAHPPRALLNRNMLPSPRICHCIVIDALLAGGAPRARAGAIPTLDGDGRECAARTDLAAGTLTRDVSCYVTARELVRWRGGSDLVIVDVRPAAEFRRVRIPGSINLPLRSLLSRPYLKARRLLLVDRGYLGSELEAGCRELRSAGFASVGIIEGGLDAWAQSMGDLEGDRAARGGLNRIPARDLAQITRFDHWLTIDVSDVAAPDLEELLPGVRRVPLGGDPAAFRQALGRVVAEREGGRSSVFVAVIDAEGSRYDEVGRALSSLGVLHAFFVEGGLDAYRNLHAAENARLAQAQVLGKAACEPR